MKKRCLSILTGVISASLGCIFSIPAHGATVVWTQWTSGTAGNQGSATGSLSALGVSVSYSGQTIGLTSNYPSWTPAGTFSGGNVGNAPPPAFNAVSLTGGLSALNTLTFGAPVTNPVLAIWSLGQPGTTATFNFTAGEPFTLQSGGGSAEYAGSSITVSGNIVSGNEGNGVILFNGTFSQLTWTNPVFENYYAFTLGVAGPLANTVPEPAVFSMVGAGLGVFVVYRLRKRSR